MRWAQLSSSLLCGISIIAASAALAQEGEEGFLGTIDVAAPETPAPAPTPTPAPTPVTPRPVPVVPAQLVFDVPLTGDRNAETVGDSNASVAVTLSDRLSSPRINNFADIFSTIANTMAGSTAQSGFVIRGINSEGQTPGGLSAPLASLYIDGIQQTVESTRRGLRGMFDVEQVEVYRGPTSTQTGRAGLAGAIFINSVRPTFGETVGHIQTTYGEGNHMQVGLAFGGELSEKLAFRISGEWSQKDSDVSYPSYTNYAGYDNIMTDAYSNAKIRFLYRPFGDEDTEILVTFGTSHDRPDLHTIAGATYGVSYDDERGDIYGDIYPGFNFGGMLLTPFPAFQEVRETWTKSFGIDATHKISDALTFTALTGWNMSHTERNSINVGTDPLAYTSPFETAETRGEFDQEIFSQELRLNYDNQSGLRWVAGLYGAKEHNEAERTLDASLLGYIEGSTATTDVTNLAAFGEVTYEFLPDLSLIAGGRLDHYSKTDAIVAQEFGIVTRDTEISFDDTVFIPKIGLQYDFSDTQSLAFVYQQGYRPGGAGYRAIDGTVYTFDAETAHNYELSYRGTFLGDRLGVTGSLFYQDWQNQQIEIQPDPLDPRTGFVTNAGESTSYGAEVEVSYAHNDRLDFFGSAGLLKTEFGEFQIGTTDFSGLPFPSAPEQTLAVGFQWGDDTGWFTGATVSYTGEFLSRLSQGGATLMNDAYTLVDFEVGYAWEQAQVTLYANNLFDERYFVNETSSTAVQGDRREIGVQFDYRF